jgi:hypothetical protein
MFVVKVCKSVVYFGCLLRVLLAFILLFNRVAACKSMKLKGVCHDHGTMESLRFRLRYQSLGLTGPFRLLPCRLTSKQGRPRGNFKGAFRTNALTQTLVIG